MADQTECIFCNPSPDALVLSTADGIVVVDYPYCEGHVLVATKKHLPDLHDLAADDASNMMRLAAEVSRKIVKRYGAVKTYVVAVGDKDRHFHVHLLPKFEDSPALGPHIFGPDGWARGAEVSLQPADMANLRGLLSDLA